jgi:hypothetical protein
MNNRELAAKKRADFEKLVRAESKKAVRQDARYARIDRALYRCKKRVRELEALKRACYKALYAESYKRELAVLKSYCLSTQTKGADNVAVA